MAVIDYFGIREATKTVLETEIPTATVRIEEEMVFGFETVPYIGIYLDRRVAIVLTWVAGLWGINIPPEVAAAIATLMHSLIGLAVTK